MTKHPLQCDGFKSLFGAQPNLKLIKVKCNCGLITEDKSWSKVKECLSRPSLSIVN